MSRSMLQVKCEHIFKIFLGARRERLRYRSTMKAVRYYAADLGVQSGFLEAGTVVPVIDRTYQLAEVAEAMRHLEQEHAQGKIVITV